MAVYGLDVYTQSRFGRDPALIRPDFAVDPFVSTALGYDTLHLTWVRPNSIDCIYLRLIRNTHNLPEDEDDGIPLWGDDTTTPPFIDFVQRNGNFTDTGLGGGFYYYTMWGFSSSTQSWVRCSDLIALVPLNWGYGYRLYNLLPMAYRDADAVLVDPYNPWSVNEPPNPTIYIVQEGDTLASIAAAFNLPVYYLANLNSITDGTVSVNQLLTVSISAPAIINNQPPLQRYLSLLGFQLDFIRTELESLTSVNDAMNCSGALLPLFAHQFGLPNEPEIGMQQERLLINNAVHLYKLKGSPRGISEFCSILTSYPMATLAHHGYNLLLTRDDGVAEDGTGTWQAWPPSYTHFPPSTPTNAAGLTLTQIPNLLNGTITGMTDPLETYTGFEPGPNPYYNDTGMAISATGAGDRWITTGRIPVTDFMSSTYGPGFITWKIQIWSTATRTVKLSVWGDAGTGVPVSIVPEQSFTENTSSLGSGHWTVMTVTAPINPYPNGVGTPNSHAAYYWVLPVIHIVGAAANEKHYVTLMGLWPCTPSDIGVNTPPYDYPRDVKVILSPQSANLLSNTLTGFENGFDGITAAIDPMTPSSNFSCDLSILYVDPEDPAQIYTKNGVGSLQVTANAPNATVWFGLVNAWTVPAPTKPAGWFTAPAGAWGSDPSNPDAGDWFPGEVLVAPARSWFDSVNGWFTMNYDYFTTGTPTYAGDWFSTSKPPPQNGNLTPFVIPTYQVEPGPAFNFSVYADYLSVLDHSNATMQIGFRWYFLDGTWTEQNIDGSPTYATYTLTNALQRYSCPPPDPSQYWMANPPDENITGAHPIAMFPFVRFPNVQQGSFLLNSAMVSPGQSTLPYFDISMFQGNADYVEDAYGGTYYYKHRITRTQRLEDELYRWIPMGASHTEIWGAEGAVPPLDPTQWTHPSVALHGVTTLAATAS
jgi:LysM repeat protein